MSKTEADIQTEIRMAISDYAVIFRVNVGSVKTIDGRYFNTGLPPGTSDLIGFRLTDAKAVFIEVKNDKGKLRKNQKHFLETMKSKGAITGVARSPQEAIDIVVNG